MDKFLSAIFGVWELRVEVVIPLGLMLCLYLRGWLRLRAIQKGVRPDVRDRPPLASPGRLAAYLAGWLILATALLSGVDAFGSMLFSVHMIQHLLLLMLAPPLLWLGNPYAVGMWGLPRSLRLEMGGLLNAGAPLRRGLRAIAKPGLAWLVMVAVTWIWHDGSLYDLALRQNWVHDLEHITFFIVGLYFWWLVTGAAPREYEFSPIKAVLFLVASVPPNAALGASIALATKPIYTYYESVPRLWGMSVLDDQRLGGVLMWAPGSMMFLMAALVFAIIFLADEEKKSLPSPSRD